MAKTVANTTVETIYVLNGPNLDPPGSRDVAKLCADAAAKFGLRADCRQSGNEAELIELIHEAKASKAAGIVIHAGDSSHRSIALHEALLGAKIPAIEVHIGNSHARENFRHHAFTAKAACATLTGFGIDGYRLAINGLAAKIGARNGVTATA